MIGGSDVGLGFGVVDSVLCHVVVVEIKDLLVELVFWSADSVVEDFVSVDFCVVVRLEVDFLVV